MSMQSMVVCHFCGSTKVTERDLCRGCGVYICDECKEKRHSPFGKHNPEDHIVMDDAFWEELEESGEDEEDLDEYGPEGEDE